MKHEDLNGHLKGEKHRGGGHKRKNHGGAQTFRRGRAIDFLERLRLKRLSLKQQLEAPEFQDIKPVILGELKAIELIIDEFIQQFELYEVEDMKETARLGE
ncbi:hypothetical protein [Neobacillus dielmonensis]|uniref:hypothetical protein n=1 Tax=Neobacillus dielmonensis TaxID=1347369 RepID=UPI000B222935|nr:hypothetical protein [Neobacillus dielmonensis]